MTNKSEHRNFQTLREEGDCNISYELYKRLEYLGIIPNNVRKSNIGESNYSEHIIEPWSIWLDWQLNPWDADIIKRVLRTKRRIPETFIQKVIKRMKNLYNIILKKEDVYEFISKEDTNEARIEDYEKIKHICDERIRQLNLQ